MDKNLIAPETHFRKILKFSVGKGGGDFNIFGLDYSALQIYPVCLPCFHFFPGTKPLIIHMKSSVELETKTILV